MRDISLHLLDLAQNSIRAGAGHVDISLKLSDDGALDIMIRDDGCGMAESLRAKAADPFATTRTTRRVGLGIPLAAANAEKTGGSLRIDSAPDRGCTLRLTFLTRSIDCPPLGALDQTMISLILADPRGPEFTLFLASPQGETRFDTAEIRKILGPQVPLCEPEVAAFLRDMLKEQIQSVLEGISN